MVIVWVILLVVLVIVVLIILGCRRVKIPRQTNFEGIETPEVVEAYDRLSRWPQFRFLRRLVVRELKKYHPAGILVDAGCGPGYLVALMVKTFPNLQIIGVDISQEMVNQASRNLSSSGYGKRAEFRLSDLQKLPFRDNEVDFVVSTLSLHHWDDPEKAIYEIDRAVKPGGQFLIFDLRRDTRQYFLWLIRFAQTLVVPGPIRRINEPTGSLLSSYTILEAKHLFSVIQLKSLTVRGGFGWMFIWGQKLARERIQYWS
jgi:ubiquinone/menaquinone biosynthesis C-methylase UbiE